MEAKLVLVLSLVAAAHCSVWSQNGFSYEVSNPDTSDIKSHLETRVDGAVYGHYSLQEPDGSQRIVSYFADENGFTADVKQSPSASARVADSAASTAAIAAPAAAPATVAVRAPAIVPGVVDARIYPAFYRTGPSVFSSWPYGL